MNHQLTTKIKQALNTELTKRLLTRYFTQKGHQNPNTPLPPHTIQDLPQQIPQLANTIEIQPNLENIDPTTGIITINWNLFILGTHRINIGQTTHTSLNNIHNPTHTQPNTTPQRIINFITKTLTKHPTTQITNTPPPTGIPLTGDHTGYYQKTNRPIY
jgi:hypothetical protein